MDVGRKWDGHRTEVGRTSDRRRTEVGQRSNGSRTDVGCKLDERRTNRAQPPLLRWQVASLHCNSWQRNVVARPAERYNSLLWRGRQNIAARCCGEADSGLQLTVAVMASGDGQQRCNSRCWAGSAATHGDGRQRYNSRR
jgi:hypothetical protein